MKLVILLNTLNTIFVEKNTVYQIMIARVLVMILCMGLSVQKVVIKAFVCMKKAWLSHNIQHFYFNEI